MSVAGVSESERMFKKSFHGKNGSGELDVFEAARYFSGYNEAAAGSYNCSTFSQKIMRDERAQPWRGGRISLDVVPMRSSNLLTQQKQTHHLVERQVHKEKKYKQPSSPGGRLASFWNSLFNQTGSKKKKSKSKLKSTAQSMKDEEESPGGRRKRRISISHFRSSVTADTKSFYSSSNSGFRTPTPYAPTPRKSYKDFRTFSDHKQAVSLSKNNNIGQTKHSALQNDLLNDNKRITTDYSWLDEKLNFNERSSEKHKNLVKADRYPPEDKEFRKFAEVDDGADSDSSSDLFELQSYDLGIYSTGLPVYETTHMDSFKRGAPISNCAL